MGALCCPALCAELALLRGLVGDVLDPDQSAEGWALRWGVCEDLDQLKATYQGLPDLLTQVCVCVCLQVCHRDTSQLGLPVCM